jgi:hypothetical protein
MSGKNAKQIRKQAMAAVGKDMNERLDKIENFCREKLAESDKRARAVQGFLIQTVQGKIQQDLWNATVTVDAIVQVLAEAGLNIENFAEKVDAKKVEISERKQREAEEAMKAKLAEQQAAAEKARAEQQEQQAPAAEQPQETPSSAG